MSGAGGQLVQLHKAIWHIANDLRGAVDGWDFKSYVLGLLFYRFICENLAGYVDANEHEAGNAGFRYATCPDKAAETVRTTTSS